MKSAEIQQELDQKRRRLAELQRELSAAAGELTTARAQHIKGDIKTGDVVQANLLHNTLKDSITTLQGEIAHLEQQHRAAVDMESKAAHREATAGAMQEATAAIDELNQLRRDVLTVLVPYMEQVHLLRERHTAARERTVSLLGTAMGRNLFSHFMDSGIFPHARAAFADIEREYGVSGAGVHAVTNATRVTVFDYPGALNNLERSPVLNALERLETAVSEAVPQSPLPVVLEARQSPDKKAAKVQRIESRQ